MTPDDLATPDTIEDLNRVDPTEGEIAEAAVVRFIEARPPILRADVVRETMSFIRGWDREDGDDEVLAGCMRGLLQCWATGIEPTL